MILKANQKYIDMSSVRHLLAKGEKNADYLTFEISKNYHNIDLSECTFILRAVNSSGNIAEQTLRKQIDDNSIFLTWTVDEYFTAVSGFLKLEIRGIKGDELVIKYDLSDIIVRESAVGEGLPELPDTTVIQGEKGDKGDDGLSAYEIWLSLGNSGTETDFIASLKGEQGIKGEKGDTGERGLQGIQGETGLTGEKGTDGFSPIIEVCENTETSYRLLITNKTNAFETPNLKGLNGVSGGETSVTIDSELSGTSENPVQNKVISSEISTLQNQISNLNELISTLQTSGGNLKITTLFDSADHKKYKDLWNFKCSYWDDRIFSFDETANKNTTFCDDKNGYSMRFSNSFGWGADITAMCSEAVEINNKSVLIVDYNCSSDGGAMTAEIIPEADFVVQKTADFEVIPAFYAVSTSYLSANFKPVSSFEKGSYYLRLNVNTTNPVFSIRKILVVSG
ncbi:MAG: collagen-like protein [Ruminococcus sp.]|nr:collagen-like protein [Ruminococcus sp.]